MINWFYFTLKAENISLSATSQALIRQFDLKGLELTQILL
jgi:hypothetical protein